MDLAMPQDDANAAFDSVSPSHYELMVMMGILIERCPKEILYALDRVTEARAKSNG